MQILYESIYPQKYKAVRLLPNSLGDEDLKQPGIEKLKKEATRLFEKFYPKMLAKARKLLQIYPPVPLTEFDLVNSVWTNFFKAYLNYDPKKNDNLEAYLLHWNNFTMRDILREYNTKRHRVLTDALPIFEEVQIDAPVDFQIKVDILDTKLGRLIFEVLNQEGLWQIFVLYFWNNIKKVQILEKLGINHYQLTKKLERIRELLETMIKPQALSLLEQET